MDIFLDLEEKMIKFCVVGKLDEENAEKDNEPKMWNYKDVKVNEMGWCPHVNLYISAVKATVRVARIPIDHYGHNIDNLFPNEDSIN